MKNTDKLIATLVSEGGAVKEAPRPVVSCAVWILGALFYVATLVLGYFGARPDLAAKLVEPLFAAETFSLLALIVTASYAATLLSFPDLYQRKRALLLPIIAAATFALVLALEWMADTPPAPPPPHAMECLLCITLLALPPALIIFYKIRRMASTRPALAGCAALLASFGIGALTLRLSEPTDSISHLLVWHYLPMIAVGLIGLALGRKIFRW